MPTWVNDGYEEYAKRLPRECQLVLQEIQPAKRGKSGHASQWVEEEGERILAATRSDHHIVSLDVTGKIWSTEQLAEQMKNWFSDGRDVSITWSFDKWAEFDMDDWKIEKEYDTEYGEGAWENALEEWEEVVVSSVREVWVKIE